MKKQDAGHSIPIGSLSLPQGNNASGNVYLYLRDLIVSGRLPEGYVFPNENDLCKLLNVGRSTLREAYTSLATLNLITRSKAGTRVNGREEIQQAIPFSKLVEHSDFWDTMDFRLMLEQKIATQAARRATEADVEALQETVVQMREHAGEIVSFSLHDAQFHILLAQITKNELLATVFKVVRKSLESAICGAFAFDPSMMPGAVEYHERIIEAIRIHDAAAAQQIMLDHISNVIDVVRHSKADDGRMKQNSI